MATLWQELQKIHVSLNQEAVCSISVDSWQRNIIDTLLAATACDSAKCQLLPEVCQHCQQLTAVSAVTMMSLIAKQTEDRRTMEMYVTPMLQPDVLQCLVSLLCHPCQVMRYQVRRAIISLCSLPGIKIHTVHQVIDKCVTMTLQHPPHLPHAALSVDCLQTLCHLMSQRPGHSLATLTAGHLLPSLLALYHHCCEGCVNRSSHHTSHTLGVRRKSGGLSGVSCTPHADEHKGSALTARQPLEEDSTPETSPVVPCKRAKCTSSEQRESLSATLRQCRDRDKSDGSANLGSSNPTLCSSRDKSDGSANLGSSNPTLCSSRDKSDGSVYHGSSNLTLYSNKDKSDSSVNYGSNNPTHCSSRDKSDGSVNHGSSNPTLCCNRDQSDGNHGSSNATLCSSNPTLCSNRNKSDGSVNHGSINPTLYSSTPTDQDSSSPGVLHYSFLCLAQKVVKAITTSKEGGEREARLQRVCETLLTPLITDHAPLLSTQFPPRHQDHHALLVVRKFLDVVDTALASSHLRTGGRVGQGDKNIAVHFVRCLRVSGCSWAFPSQRTFIGTCARDRGRGAGQEGGGGGGGEGGGKVEGWGHERHGREEGGGEGWGDRRHGREKDGEEGGEKGGGSEEGGKVEGWGDGRHGREKDGEEGGEKGGGDEGGGKVEEGWGDARHEGQEDGTVQRVGGGDGEEEEALEVAGEGSDSDNPVLLLLVSVALKACALVCSTKGELDEDSVSACVTLLHSMHRHLHPVFEAHTSPVPASPVPASPAAPVTPVYLCWLPQVCGEQDDRWLDALLCLLDIFLHTRSLYTQVEGVHTLLNPHHLFLQLVHHTHLSPSLLLDWLTSPETCCLAYLTRYLRLLTTHFHHFRLAAHAWSPSVTTSSLTEQGTDLYSKAKVTQHIVTQPPKHHLRSLTHTHPPDRYTLVSERSYTATNTNTGRPPPSPPDSSPGVAREATEADLVVDRVMSLVASVRESLERLDRGGLLVYNPAPLVALMKRCEHCWKR